MPIRFLFFSLCWLFYSMTIAAQEGVWILVDSKKLLLDVKRGDVTLQRFENIAIGRNGAGFKQQRGDDTTPLGQYHISWINRKSRYNLFYGFNYPSRENAQQARKQGLITQTTYQNILRAHNNHQLPPQNTPLGGMLGIHGLGRGDLKIHQTINWTHGCIALNNEQIQQLDSWIQKDTLVIVK